MYPKLGLTRNVLRRNYALVTPDGYVPSPLPRIANGKTYVLISRAMGAGVTQILMHLEAGGSGIIDGSVEEWVMYVLAGPVEVDGQALGAGGYKFVPAHTSFAFQGIGHESRILLFGKKWEPVGDAADAVPPAFTSHESSAPEAPFLGDPRARLKTLLPDTPTMDMAVNIFTYDPGATLPFVETHVMEHGMYFLEGSGVYRLGDDWHPIQAGDSLWIAPYCPQWFIAAGPGPARYIYYKDVNRMP